MDFSNLVTWMDGVTNFFNDAWTFLDSGMYSFFKDALEVFVKASIWSMIQFKIICVRIAYDVVQELLQDTGVVDLVKNAWNSIPGDIQDTLAFFKLPQGLALIFSAIPTRWAMKFIPGAS